MIWPGLYLLEYGERRQEGKLTKERFVVLWRRGPGVRCQYRTTDTERSLGVVLGEIRSLLEENGVAVEVRVEEVAGDVSEVYFNGLPLQDLVEEIARAEAYCSGPSRMEELGHPEIAYDPEARVGCVVPEIIFRKAVLIALEE